MTEQQDEAPLAPRINVDELSRAMHHFGVQMQAAIESTMPGMRRIVNGLHALLFPARHKRMMLRDARQRARLSTQVRRGTKRP